MSEESLESKMHRIDQEKADYELAVSGTICNDRQVIEIGFVKEKIKLLFDALKDQLKSFEQLEKRVAELENHSVNTTKKVHRCGLMPREYWLEGNAIKTSDGVLMVNLNYCPFCGCRVDW